MNMNLLRSDQVAAVLERLSPKLEPHELLSSLNATFGKGDMDNDTLGHAYYTLYFGRVKTFAPLVRPESISLFGLYHAAAISAKSAKQPSLNVVKKTEPAVYVSSVCDAILRLPHDTRVIPIPVFCQAIRNVHPHEIKNDYYHLQEICGLPFDAYLVMVNARLSAYFSDNHILDDVLSGIKKCLCLRMLSNSMYHYRDHPEGLVLDPAIVKLIEFYTLTGFLHPSSEEAFRKHWHMILKYKQLQNVIEELISPNFKKHARSHKIGFISIVTVEPAYFEIAIGGHKYRFNQVQDLQAFIHARFGPVVVPRMSSNDMVHKVQSYFSNPRLRFDEGIRFMRLLTTRLDKGELTLDDNTYNDLYQIYELTIDALRSLHELRRQRAHDDEVFFTMMQKMDEYNLKHHPPRLNRNKVDWSVASPRSSPRSYPLSGSRKRKRGRSGGAKTKNRKTKNRRSKS
jgi:hypothetical protein